MKKTINFSLSKLLFLPLIILMTFTSCQDEITEVTEPNDQETLVANSVLANLMQSTSLRDGSFDNIVDSANCLSINLPVTITVNGVTITIQSVDDYEALEELLEQFDDDEDEIEIQFPITITLSNYEEVTINSYEELNTFIDECFGENEDDDDIECIDFQYPISISVFNADFVVVDTVEINSDEELYNFIEDLDGSLLASINFPVTMILADGSTVVVNNNDELQEAIEAAEDTCDEDDDYDYDDDDEEYDCDEEDVDEYFAECQWVGDINGTADFNDYQFYFLEDQVLKAIDLTDNTLIYGTWMTSEDDNDNVVVTIEMPAPLQDFNGEWTVIECDDERIKMTRGDDYLVYERDDCEAYDCTEEQIELSLKECFWNIPIYNDSDVFADVYIDFETDYDFVAFVGDDLTYAGEWSVNESNSGNYELTLTTSWEDLNGTWEVVNCDANYYQFIKQNVTMKLAKDCDSELVNPFPCYDDWDYELTSCDYDGDDIANFNIYEAFPNCSGSGVTLSISFHLSEEGAENNTDILSEATSFDNTSSNQSVYIKVSVFNNTDIYEIYPVALIVEDCTTPCSEEDVNAYLEACIWNVVSVNGDDHLIDYDFDFNTDGELIVTNTITNEVGNANWEILDHPTTGRLILGFTNLDNTDLSDIYGNWGLKECAEDRLEFEKDDGSIMVLEKDCN